MGRSINRPSLLQLGPSKVSRQALGKVPSLMRPPSDHLLRTLAAVPVTSTILDLGCGYGRHTVPLLRLGFEVQACDENEAAVRVARERTAPLVDGERADSRVRVASLSTLDYPDTAFDWIVAYRPEAYVASEAGLEEAAAPEVAEAQGEEVVRAIFRRVDAHTPV